jgi:hypothetical protein
VSERRAARGTSATGKSWMPIVIPTRAQELWLAARTFCVMSGRSHFQIVSSDEERQELRSAASRLRLATAP